MLAYSLQPGVGSMAWVYPEQLWRRLVDLLVNTLELDLWAQIPALAVQ